MEKEDRGYNIFEEILVAFLMELLSNNYKEDD